MTKKSENKISKTCERCNSTLTREWTFKDYFPVNTDGWHTTQGKLICPQCFAHGLILFNKFMRKEL
jgi:hypothetical protein